MSGAASESTMMYTCSIVMSGTYISHIYSSLLIVVGAYENEPESSLHFKHCYKYIASGTAIISTDSHVCIQYTYMHKYMYKGQRRW